MQKIARRTFLDAAAGLVALVPISVWSQTVAATVDRVTWMEHFRPPAQTDSRASVGPLRLQWFSDPMWALTEPITWIPEVSAKTDLKTVTVPRGFVTDLTSVPPEFFSLLRPEGPYAYAAVIHDYLYWLQQRPRLEADEILRLVMDEFSVSTTDKWAIYAGVRVGGGLAWKKNAELRASGEKRILKKFPVDPREKWTTWKSRADVFV